MKQARKTETDAPRIAQLPALRVAGLTRRYPATPEAMRELAGQWQDFAQGPGSKLLASGPVMYGIHVGLFGDGGEDDYCSGVEIGTAGPIPAAGLSELRLPPITCAVIDHAGPASEISHTTSALLRWLPQSGYRLAQTRPFDLIERYGTGFDPRTARGDMQLVVPVEEA